MNDKDLFELSRRGGCSQLPRRGGCSQLRQICNLTQNIIRICNPKYNNLYPITQKTQRKQ